ncbi:MAG TPA: peptidylprolyl isomerase [Polyangiaceae bacterium]
MRSPLPFLIVVVACGGSQPAAQTHTEQASADTPAAKCLAVANAKRERRADEPEKVTVKHLVVKWSGVKRAPATITRTREEACLRAQEARAKLEKGASFGDVVKEYSDEEGAATREGMLGSIKRADAAPPFADAAFELHVGDVSYVVETDFGFHVIMRTE